MTETASTDFDFYLKFTKPLVLSLPSSQDRALAASWIKKLISDSASPELKGKYLKVLLLSLQKKKLNGVFNKHPQDLDITEENLALDTKKRYSQIPWFTYDFSPDLLQYAAVQEIQDFGVHAFFAMSPNSIGSWDNTDDLILPQPTKDITTSLMSDEKSEPKAKENAELKKKKLNFAKSIIKSVQAPSQPIGKLPDGAEEKKEEKWQRPNWDSNLIKVNETDTSKSQDAD